MTANSVETPGGQARGGKPYERPVGIVLGGGGTLGDFQVGALQFLLRHLKQSEIDPQIFCGTSVGAVNAAAAAAAAATGKNVSKLKDLWLKGVIDIRQFYEFEEWFDGLGPNLQALAKGGIVERGIAIVEILRQSAVDIVRHRELSATLVDILKDASDANLSALKLEPLRNKFIDLFGDDLEEVVRSPRIKLALTAVNLETGDLEYFCNPACRGQLKRISTDCSSQQSLTQAIFASASVPGLLKPAEICGKNFVDGSVREIAPAEAATDLGAKTLFVILALAYNLRPATSIITDHEITDWRVQANFIDIARRATNALLNETVKNDLAPYKSRCITIDPQQNIHPFFEFHVGLISINIDYGFMRAFDVVVGPTMGEFFKCGDLTERIIAKRLRIWKLEHELIADWTEARHQSCPRYFSPLRHVVDTSIVFAIRAQRIQLHQLVEERLDLCGEESFPENPEHVWKDWETHNWDLKEPTALPLMPTPWDGLDLGYLGTEVVPKENPPRKVKKSAHETIR
jgi:predicted acylesterase/phospholipase RssA